ncbi:FHA domain-containing protein PS1 [Phalaenopsis equestris]|uniref:FHA domain-containing protein PS1 n=1 Tax=Phalaenopsis equestris TaxID=78828 RepID=UPI0009E2ECC8|nr:FHA domain-containing protein PS1 [Phalaenopsis equestris]
MEDAKIPVFSVLKKGAVLKNIFLNSPPPETGKPLSPSRDNDPILMGRHPDCDIVVDHPSISRFHVEVRPKSSLQKLFVTDRSSVHGTWVSGKKIQPNIPIELIEGDSLRLGASTRIYRLYWMPLSQAFEMNKPMSPLIEEASDFMDNDEVFQDENLNEVGVSNIIPSAPPMMASSPGKVFSLDLEKGDQILISQEMLEQNSCYTSMVPFLESMGTSWPLKEEIGAKNIFPNEMQPEGEGPSPFRSDKIVKSSSLLSRRNKSISFLQIENTSEEIRSEIRKIKEDLGIEEQMAGAFAGGSGEEEIHLVLLAEGNVKEEEEESFISDKANMTPGDSIGSKLPKGNQKIERSPLSSFNLFHKKDLGVSGNGEEIPSVLVAEGDVKEEEEATCSLDDKKTTLINSIGSEVLKSNIELNSSLLISLNISDKHDLEIEEQKVETSARGKGVEKIPTFFIGADHVKEEEETLVSDKDSITLVNFIGSKILRSNSESETSPLSSLSTFNLEEHPSNSDKRNPTSVATEHSNSTKLKSRSRLMKENGESPLSGAKSLESVFSPGRKLQRSLFKAVRSPLGQKKNLNLEDDRFLSDKENWTPKVPNSLKSGKAFTRDILNAESEENETFASDKENLTPQSSIAIKSKNAASQNHGKKEGESTRKKKERIPFQPLFVSSPLRNSSPASYAEGLDETFGNNGVIHNLDAEAPESKQKKELPQVSGREKKKWYIVVDVGCFLIEESRKSLQLLEGIRGTQLIIPRIVIRELDHLKRCQGILSRGTKASSVLQWIEESMMKTSWWIHVQSSSETFAAAPTPPATPRSQLYDGSSGFSTATSSNFYGFSTCGSFMEIVSPTAEDHILDCALLFKKMKDDGELMLLTSSTTLRIKAMAEGLLCETPKEFRESLVNPLSKRFLWADSCSPRGSTWSCLEEVGLFENGHQQFTSARMAKVEGNVKGLKLVLLHGNPHCGMTNLVS